MKKNISLKCQCGAVRGIAQNVSPSDGNRVVCMCDDCQAFAHFLGRADQIMDKNGGTDIFQLAPAQVRFTSGMEKIRCMRLHEKGLFRWYTNCCKTPIANTLGAPKLPFAGMIHLFMDHQSDKISRDEAIGPIRAKIFAKYGFGDLPPDAYQKGPVSLILRSVRLLGLAWVKGGQSPFFDSNGNPIAQPTVLTKEARDELRIRPSTSAAK